MFRRLLSWLALPLLGVLFVAINLLSDTFLRGYRLDLTADRLYTLSPATTRVLTSIEEPLTLRFYYSELLGRTVPSYGIYAQRVRDILEEYASLSQGRIRLETYDPQPFSDIEDRAVAEGLQAVPLDAQTGDQVYFGLAGSNAVDDAQVIPFFQPERERFLEFDLTRMVQHLARPKRPVVALLADLPVDGQMMPGGQGATPPWVVMSQLRQTVTLRTVGTEIDAIDDDVEVALIIHPKNFSERTQYALDQFALRGGRILAFVDPYSEAEAMRPTMPGMPPMGGSSNLPRLFKAWGVELVEGKFVGDRFAARRVSAGSGSRVQAVDYVAWLQLRGDIHLQRQDSATTELQQVNMATAGALKPVAGAGTTFRPLLSSSPAAMLIDVDKVARRPDPLGLLRDYRAGNEVQVLAARLTGPLKTAFPDGPPKPPENAPAPDPSKVKPHLAQSQKDADIVVVADTDLLDDRFWVQVQDFFGQQVVVPNANNADFVVNVAETLTGGPSLIELRGRGVSQRPFVVFDELRREAETRFRQRERELQDKLKATEDKLKSLQTREAPGGGVILSDEQRKAIEDARTEILTTRLELRDVQRALRESIEALQQKLLFLNIGAVPAVVAVLGLLLAAIRVMRRRRVYGQ